MNDNYKHGMNASYSFETNAELHSSLGVDSEFMFIFTTTICYVVLLRAFSSPWFPIVPCQPVR